MEPASMVINNTGAGSPADSRGRAGRPAFKPSDQLAMVARQMDKDGHNHEAIYKVWQERGYSPSKGTRLKYLRQCLANDSRALSQYPDDGEEHNPAHPLTSMVSPIPILITRPTLDVSQLGFATSSPSSDEMIQPTNPSPIWMGPGATCSAHAGTWLSQSPSLYPANEPGVYLRNNSSAMPFMTTDTNPAFGLEASAPNERSGNTNPARMVTVIHRSGARNVVGAPSSLLAPSHPGMSSDDPFDFQEQQLDDAQDFSNLMFEVEMDQSSGEIMTLSADNSKEAQPVRQPEQYNHQLDTLRRQCVPDVNLLGTQYFVHPLQPRNPQLGSSSATFGNVWQQSQPESTAGDSATDRGNSNLCGPYLPTTSYSTGQLSRSAPSMSRNFSSTFQTSSRGRPSHSSTSERVSKPLNAGRMPRSPSRHRARSMGQSPAKQKTGVVDSGYGSQQSSRHSQSFEFVPTENNIGPYMQSGVVEHDIAQHNNNGLGYSSAAETSLNQDLIAGNTVQHAEAQSTFLGINNHHNGDTSVVEIKRPTLNWQAFGRLHEYLQRNGLMSTAATLCHEIGVPCLN